MVPTTDKCAQWRIDWIQGEHHSVLPFLSDRIELKQIVEISDSNQIECHEQIARPNVVERDNAVGCNQQFESGREVYSSSCGRNIWRLGTVQCTSCITHGSIVYRATTEVSPHFYAKRQSMLKYRRKNEIIAQR